MQIIESITPINESEFRQYLQLSLKQNQGNQSVSFIDAAGLSLANKHTDLKLAFSSNDLLIPRGRGINVSIKLIDRGQATSTNSASLYRELLLTLESSEEPVLLFTDNKKIARKAEHEIEKLYPNLNLKMVICDTQHEESYRWYIDKIEALKPIAVLFALDTQRQQSVLNKIKSKTNTPLLVGLGYPFFDAVFEISEGFNFSRLRHSILLSPIRFLKTLPGVLNQIIRTKDKESSRINTILTEWGWSTRLKRITIRTKSSTWVLRCKMQSVLKRVIDLMGAGIGLLFLLPLLIPVAIGIKLTSPGPLFYSQTRVGLLGKTFRMWKFRSMYIDADARKAALMAQNESSDGVIFKMKKDPRITPIGRVIRRLSIDELPQLYNVLIGEMSLVGPRPALESEVAEYPVLARARLEVLPGLTGLWQISGRSDLPFDKQVLLDTTYVNQQSITNDIKLIAKTVPAVVSGKGAY